MDHPHRIYQRLLEVFERNEGAPLTPAYVAYEFDTTTQHAEQMLDELVKHSRLELDFDDNGQLYYSLPVRHRAERGARQASRAADLDEPYGADGSIGHAAGAADHEALPAGWRREPAPVFDRSGPDGCDGSLRPSPSSWADIPASLHGKKHPGGVARDVETSPNHVDATMRTEGAMIRARDGEIAVERRADPMIAALLSVLLVGSGQLYNREVSKGVMMFVAWWVLWTFALGWIVNVWAVVDAYSVANQRRDPDPE